MKRDDPALCEPRAAEPSDDEHRASAASRVLREPSYIGAARTLFSWYHTAPEAPQRDAVAVVCAPLGPEYTRAHRSLRHLADRLARLGIPALRFDYHGVGDSAGGEEDTGLFERWRASVVEAAQEARRLSGRKRVCLVGLRLGATLATLAASEAQAEVLAMWNPVEKGRTYARELQAMALISQEAPDAPADGLDSAGFRIHEETLASIRALDLERATVPAGARVRRWKRDELPGWDGMMADHQFTVVPDEALDTLAEWIASQVPVAAAPRANDATAHDTLALGDVNESLCRFGPGGHLFGILAQPTAASAKPAVLMLNAGSIHHVGPHRLYVRLARDLARAGHAVLRLDLEGIGDSVLRGGGRENHPYSPTARQDFEAALAFLRARGLTRFVVLGLCSGAYNTFQAGLHAEDPGVERLVMINPWYFEWREGLSLDTTIGSHYEDVAAYSRSMRDPQRWKRLLRGEADLGRLARVALAHATKVARGRWDDLRELLVPSSGSQLSQDVRRIASRGRRMHVILSDGEPAAALLDTEAKLAVKRAKRSGLFSLDRIPGGDHTFSRSAPRDALVRLVLDKLTP